MDEGSKGPWTTDKTLDPHPWSSSQSIERPANPSVFSAKTRFPRAVSTEGGHLAHSAFKLLLPAEVALILRRPVASIYELAKQRKIVCVRDGRRVRFRPQDIEAYITNHLIEPLSNLPGLEPGAKPRSRRTPDRNGGVL